MGRRRVIRAEAGYAGLACEKPVHGWQTL